MNEKEQRCLNGSTVLTRADVENADFARRENVIIPEGVTGIEDRAFQDCRHLESVTIPDSVTEIEGNPFAGCGSLKEIRVSPGHRIWEIVDGVLFSRPDRRLVCYPCSRPPLTYAIPRGAAEIGNGAFSGCVILKDVRIPESVTKIGYFAFARCAGLQTVIIPKGVKEIAGWTFFQCTGLTDVTIPEGVTDIGQSAFLGCKSLKDVRLPESVTGIANFAFADCTGLTDVTLPKCVISMAWGAFLNCPSVKLNVIRGSETEAYCRKHDIRYVSVPGPEGPDSPEYENLLPRCRGSGRQL